MKRYLPRAASAALATAIGGACLIALLNLPSGTPWPLALLIIAGFSAIYGFLDYFLPYAVMCFRLRRLSSSRFKGVRETYLGALAQLHSEYPKRSSFRTQQLGRSRSKWALALLPRPELTMLVTTRRHNGLDILPAESVKWLGDDSYEMFHSLIIVHEGTPRSAITDTSRLMAIGYTDYETFYGYCESAGVEAALLAIEHDLPLEYARELTAE